MATLRFIGNAAPITQVTRLVPTNVEIGDIFKAYMGGSSTGREVTFTATAGTVANVTAGLTAAIAASTHPEWTEVTATDSVTHVTLTADTPGYPFTVASTATDGGGVNTQTLGTTHATTPSGPDWWNEADNWDTGAAPTNGDSVDLSNWTGNIVNGLGNSATTLAEMTQHPTFTGTIGLPERNANGYAEYRTKHLQIGCARTNIYGSGTRVKIDNGSGVAELNVYDTGASAETGIKTVQWLGTNAANVVNVTKGSVAIAQFGGSTAVVADLRIAYKTNQAKDASVYVGPGCSLTRIKKSGGELEFSSSATIAQTGGETIYNGTAGLTGTMLGGSLRYRSSGTLATFVVEASELDFRQDMRPKSASAITLRNGATIRDPAKCVNFDSSGIIVQGAVTLDFGPSFTIYRSTV